MATLNEGIAKIEAGSVLETLYNRLLAGFKSSQDDSLPDFTSSDYVIESIDSDGSLTYTANETKINAAIAEYKEITMKNAAYLLATSIQGSNSSSGGDSGGGSGGDGTSSNNLFVAITGDTMTGKLNAWYGFSTGANGVKIMDVYQTTEENAEDRTSIVKIDGELHLNPHGLFINEKNVLWYDNDVLGLEGTTIQLNGDVVCSSSLKIGDTVIDENGISMGDKEFYHSGNANKEDVDWTMKNATVAGDLTVKGTSTLSGMLTALYGVSLGYGGVKTLSIEEANVVGLWGDLNFLTGGVKIDGDYAINKKNEKVWSFSAPNRTLNLGDNDTTQINLQADVYDDDGEYLLISKFGDGYFPNSFKAGFNLGNVLIETYKNNTEDAGAIFSRYIRLNNAYGPGFYSDGDDVFFEGPFRYNTGSGDDSTQTTEYKTTQFGYVESSSLYTPQNKKSASLRFITDADFYVFDKPVEGKNSIGIAESKTRLLDGQLFFDDSVYWQALEDGAKYYGNAYMVGSIGSVTFSSGFAGSGWKIYKNQLTGNISATFDELTIRKKMRIYELEVQKLSVTNGSLWVSDACSGDIAEEVE